ncbi:hypothetical protein B0T16DRAFT_10383 [Cercophora newfieldiana]|uniref:Uncharacterized protein n=1 Tax=Cercophora newfieldiana TaxID=92897 RepID=A0AA39YPI6_9PEZI|nr:hypothetical protein B0T16DRAFT_10383 [Cercophora newfieldiana]
MTAARTTTDEHDTTNTSNLSISRLIATHPRERLFVHPLLWTTRHLSLLGCQFLDLGAITVVPLPLPSPQLVPAHRSTSNNNDGNDAITKAQYHLDASVARRLATCRVPITKGHALSRLLLRQQLICHGRQVRFHYARRTVAQLPCCPFSRPRQSTCLPAAQLVYLDLSEITHHRTTKLKGQAPAPGGGGSRRINPPGSRRAQKLLQRLSPADPCEDPYLVALLIAMAQEQRMDREVDCDSGKDEQRMDREVDCDSGKDGGGGGGRGSSNTARCPPPMLLLATCPADTAWLHIYTSNLSAEFLDRLDHPSYPLPPAAVVPPATIYRRRLAFEPYDTLPQRLAAVIVDARSDSVRISLPGAE